ncbi:chlorite dismutase family protein [Polyangium jinanense]|uniref:Chlorite dismutase family protein n=1 Tax=Polyangium jinanense TaxID=2829994 RepID=A0A9X3X3M6_9BACT|nr:chlorite dismutase family protein [Polyangium jinanense]MDC3958164.1 chlorite dismutase family protein [Polyangium jinanense]MDC3983637.1 chlorite dismutase family protein [Polyangium jinanense]
MSEANPSGRAAGHSHGQGSEELPVIDVSERGAPRDGKPQTQDRRLFMQLLVFQAEASNAEGVTRKARSIRSAIASKGVGVVVYEDVNDPSSIGLLTWGEDPAVFVEVVRPAILDEGSAPRLHLRPDMTMLGRTYSTGYEQDLEFWLLRRPAETVANPAWPWAVWYPLRRSGAFAKLEPREQGSILREHGTIGKAYGAKDLAHDIRLACHGLDARDNEFVIGLVGKELHPLSHIVQAMRKTRQTSEFISQMGPFFVGRVLG